MKSEIKLNYYAIIYYIYKQYTKNSGIKSFSAIPFTVAVYLE